MPGFSVQSAMRSLLPLALLWAVLNSDAAALEVAGVRLGEETHLEGRALRLNGAGVRTWLGFRVYVAALYLPRATRDAQTILRQDAPRRLQVTLLRDTTTEQNLDALRGGLEDNHVPAELKAIEAEIAQFFQMIRQVHEVPAGARITLDYLPGSGTRVSIGERYLGTIAGESFNRAILKIWLGEAPIQASLKRSLLGVEKPEL